MEAWTSMAKSGPLATASQAAACTGGAQAKPDVCLSGVRHSWDHNPQSAAGTWQRTDCLFVCWRNCTLNGLMHCSSSRDCSSLADMRGSNAGSRGRHQPEPAVAGLVIPSADSKLLPLLRGFCRAVGCTAWVTRFAWQLNNMSAEPEL